MKIIIIIFIISLIFILVNSKFNKEGMDKTPASKLCEARKIAMKYLRYMKKNNFMNIKKPAAMFDIDDTLIDTVTHQPMVEITKLLEECKKAGMYIVIITARLDRYLNYTIEELKYFGIYYDRLYLRNSKDNINVFKENIKEQLAVQENIYTVFSIGDNYIDVKGNWSGFWIKLPNQEDNRLYSSEFK